MKKSLFFVLMALVVVFSCQGELPELEKPSSQDVTSDGAGDEPGDTQDYGPGVNPRNESRDESVMLLQVNVTTGAATAVGTDKATLQGSVSVSGAAISAVSVSFHYSATASTVEELVASGESVEGTMGEDGAFSASLEGLSYGTNYCYVAVASVEGNLFFYGEVKNFATEVPELVDMGLSVKWRSWNLGAMKPEEYGDYYAWGETEPKEDYPWSTYAWGDMHYDYDLEMVGTLTKYCPSNSTSYWAGEGDPDGKTVLDAADDAAVVRLGGSWRMPTDEEFAELRSTSNCTWERTVRNGIYGYKVTSKKLGFTDRWIFLPAAGLRYTDLYGVGTYGVYWSSSLYTDRPYFAWGLSFESGNAASRSSRCGGQSVRPVMGSGDYPDPLQVNVTTGAATAVGTDGATLQGSVSVSGADVSEASVSFRYSATESTVDGLLASGIEVSAEVGEDGAFHASLQDLAQGTVYRFVAVATVHGELFHGAVKSFRTELAPEAVDLGLSVKWASCNLGASKPEEYGDYYAWGETEPKENYLWSNYAFGEGIVHNPLVKYWRYGKTVLDPEDDAAVVRLGGSWRMPTDDEFTELRSTSNCTWEWSTRNGINGYKVTSNKAGFTDRWIFLPAAGGRGDAIDYRDVGSYGNYWSSFVLMSSSCGAMCLIFGSDFVWRGCDDMCGGMPVRPVSE